MEKARLVLDYIQVLLNWPLVVLILGFVFKGAIIDFIKRLIRGKGPGFEIDASLPTEQRKEAKESLEQRPEDGIEKYIKENPGKVKIEYLKIFNGYWFERAYNLIYGTQIQLLECLSLKRDTGEKYINLFSYYSDFLQKSKFNTQMADYIGFLIDMKFAEYVGQNSDLTVKITPYGCDFLSYIKSQYSLAYRYKAF